VSGGHGGRRAGAGRKQGIPNRCSAEVRTIAQEFGPRCIEILAAMAGLTDGPPATAEPVRLGALKELLDRAYGRATQPVSGDDSAAPIAYSFRWADALPPPPHEPEAVEDAATGILVTFATETC
jgi:hypothetical protein